MPPKNRGNLNGKLPNPTLTVAGIVFKLGPISPMSRAGGKGGSGHRQQTIDPLKQARLRPLTSGKSGRTL